MTPEELRKWREKHKVSQSELASILGVHRFTVSKWESEVQRIPPYLPFALAEVARLIKAKKPRKGD